MFVFLTALFIFIIILAFVEDNMTEVQKCCILTVLSVSMIAVAAFKDITVVADAEEYERMFYNNDDILIEISTEPTFIYISRLVLALGGGIAGVFFIYAAISVPLKIMVMQKMTPWIFSALIIYVARYYTLHDLVQIRAGAACAMLMIAVYYLVNKRPRLCAVFFVIAITFHYSSLASLPILLVGNRKANKTLRFIMASIIPIGFAMAFLGKDIFSLVPSSVVTGKVELYSTNAFTYDTIVPYKSGVTLIKCMLFCLFLYYYEYLSERVKYFPLLMYFEAASICAILMLTTIPVLCIRLSELYGFIEPLLFICCIHCIKPQYLARIFIALVGTFILIANIHNNFIS